MHIAARLRGPCVDFLENFLSGGAVCLAWLLTRQWVALRFLEKFLIGGNGSAVYQADSWPGRSVRQSTEPSVRRLTGLRARTLLFGWACSRVRSSPKW